MGDTIKDSSEAQDRQHLAIAANLSRLVTDMRSSACSFNNINNEQASRFLDMNTSALYHSDCPILAQAKVFEQPASQATEPMPPVSERIRKAPDSSPFALNIQITNVPEVSPAIRPEQWLHHVGSAFGAGAEAVRSTEAWLAKSNAIHDSLVQLGPTLDTAVNYYSTKFPVEIARDAEDAVTEACKVLEKTFAFPHSAEDRAKTAGMMIPMFFFDGKVTESIHRETVQQLGLEKMSEQKLGQLGIVRRVREAEAGDMTMPEVPAHLKDLPLKPIPKDLVEAVESKGRIVTFGEPGSEVGERLRAAGAEALTMYPECSEILIKPDAPRVALLEEYLHGTQAKLGIIERYELRAMAEVHVKDFMLRHPKLLGLDANDSILLRVLRDNELKKLEKWGYRQVPNE
jgi:hypothetical protein